jgi:stage V sporulation protein G
MTTPALIITDCRVRPCTQQDARLLAFATITLNQAFVVCDLKIILGNEGIFVAMPSRRRRDGSFRDVAHPLNADVRGAIERIVLSEYLRELKRVGLDFPGKPAHISMDDVLSQPALRAHDAPSWPEHEEDDDDHHHHAAAAADTTGRPASASVR